MVEDNLLLGLRQYREQIVERWIKQVKDELADGSETTAELQNHIPDFLAGIEAVLAGGDAAVSSSALRARAHGKQRYRIGFELKTVVQEYNMLVKIILNVVHDAGLAVNFGEVRRLYDCISAAIADAVEEHSLQQKDAKAAAHAAELEQLRERAEFEKYLTSIVSHDLRNPLSAITLAVDAMFRRGNLDERVNKSLVRIKKSAEKAMRLVEDLLDFARIRLGTGIPVERKPASLLDVVKSTIEEVSQVQPEAQIRTTCDGNPTGNWDAERMGQVVQNLLLNALEHAQPASEVQLNIEDDGAEVTLACTNAGQQMTPKDLQSIFDPMQRGEQQKDMGPRRGLGLGLYIVRHIVEAHGGEVSVTSTQSTGTTFTVRLPRSVAPPAGHLLA